MGINELTWCWNHKSQWGNNGAVITPSTSGLPNSDKRYFVGRIGSNYTTMDRKTECLFGIIRACSRGSHSWSSEVDLSRTLGWFTSIFPVYLHLDKTQELGALLKCIKEQLHCIPQHGMGYCILRYLTKRELQTLYQMSESEVSFNSLG